MNVKLAIGKNYKSNLNAASFITTVDARNNANAITIKGNAKNNVIYGGAGANTLYGVAGNDALNGGAGNDTLYGGAGNDTLIGGDGKDKFVYANGEGSDVIKDYTAAQDMLQISNGSISKTLLANSNKDLVFTVGSGKVTLSNAAAKTVSLKDSRGSYTASNTVITLGSDFGGTLDANKYLSTIKKIDGRNATKAVNIAGNAQDNIIYAGKAGGTINGGTGNDTLYGGAGKDTFSYTSGTSVIKDFAAGEALSVASAVTNVAVKGENIVLTAGTGSLTVTGGKGKLKEITEAGKKKKLYITSGGGLNGSSYDDIIAAIGVIDTDYGTYGYGANNVYGGKGNDSLIVTDSVFSSYLFGGDGNDTIYINGGSGNYLYGGSDLRTDPNPAYTSNKNTFVFSSGNATISDFKAADTLKLEKALTGVTVEQYTTSDPLDPAAHPEEHNRFVLLCGPGNTLEVEEAIGKLTRLNEKGRSVVLPSVTMDGTTAAIVLDKSFANRQLSVVMHTENVVIDASSVGKGTVVSVSSDPGQSVTFTGGAGKDVIYVQGNGSSTLSGGSGDDEMTGGAGNDELHGGAGNDAVFGGYGNDYVYGDAGNDRLYGSYGNDTLAGGDGNDMFFYQGGHDTILDYHNYGSGLQQDQLVAEDIKIIGVKYNRYADSEYGINAGDVTLTTENGGSITLKRFWDDSYALITDERGNYALRMFENGTEPVISLGSEIQEVTFIGNEFDASGMTFETDDGRGVNMLEIDAGGATTRIGIIRGSNSVYTDISGCNVYDGSSYNCLYAGSRGATLNGGNGKDRLTGSDAFDQLYGNAGNDWLEGNGDDDELYGGDGNDNLYGGAGNDWLYGGDGNDSFYGGAGADWFVFDNECTTESCIKDYQAGSDIIRFEAGGLKVNSYDYDANDILLTLSNGGSIRLENYKGETIEFFGYGRDGQSANQSSYFSVFGPYGP